MSRRGYWRTQSVTQPNEAYRITLEIIGDLFVLVYNLNCFDSRYRNPHPHPILKHNDDSIGDVIIFLSVLTLMLLCVRWGLPTSTNAVEGSDDEETKKLISGKSKGVISYGSPSRDIDFDVYTHNIHHTTILL